MFLKISEDKVINTDHLAQAVEKNVFVDVKTRKVTDLYFIGGSTMRIELSLKEFVDFMSRMQSLPIKGL